MQAAHCSLHNRFISTDDRPCLFTFRTGMIKLLPGIQSMCTYTSYMGSYSILSYVVFIVAPCNAAVKDCDLPCFRLLGWMTIYLNNTYGFRDSRSNSSCLVREVAVWFIFLDAMITYDRSNGTSEAIIIITSPLKHHHNIITTSS